jgi:uncharacterized protein YjbI with pentapeptide repeats
MRAAIWSNDFMANQGHLDILKLGVDRWNNWRNAEPQVVPDLANGDMGNNQDFTGANLNGANLFGFNFNGCVLHSCDFSDATLIWAQLSATRVSHSRFTRADLSSAVFVGAHIHNSDFSGCNLRRANLSFATLFKTSIVSADLENANLEYARLLEVDADKANLRTCQVHGISVWDLTGHPTQQTNLTITREQDATITVDNLEVAQFIYLLLNNEKLRHVIDTITSKVVLILGRFTPERKPILDAIRVELRRRNYLPVLFDFDKPSNRDITETVSTLAHMAKFVIADITDAKSIPQELMAIVPALPSVPVQPLLLASLREYGMFEHFKRYPWVLEPYLYEDQDGLLAALTEKVIEPAEEKVREQTGK